MTRCYGTFQHASQNMCLNFTSWVGSNIILLRCVRYLHEWILHDVESCEQPIVPLRVLDHNPLL
jgi:hypothetical protein